MPKWLVSLLGLLLVMAVPPFLVLTNVNPFMAPQFDAFFVVFHRIFFVGDSWLFAYADSRIQFYPELL